MILAVSFLLFLRVFLSIAKGKFESNSSSQQNNIYPCSGKDGSVVKYDTDVWTVVNDYSNCSGEVIDDYPVLRVTTETKGISDKRQPLVFVTRSDENVQTWKLFANSTSSRTICSTVFRDENTIEEDVTMYIDVFTSNTEDVPYNITVKPVVGFQLKLGEDKNITVTKDDPQLYYFKFPQRNDSDGHVRIVQVTASSDNENACVIVSVQNATCPVNDVLVSAGSKGVYQTMTTSASLNIVANKTIEYDNFFIVLKKADPSLCFTDPSHTQLSTDSVNITLKIVRSYFAYHYGVALALPPIVLFVVGLCAIGTFWVPCFHTPFHLNMCFCSKSRRKSAPLFSSSATNSISGSSGDTSDNGAAGTSKPLTETASSCSSLLDDSVNLDKLRIENSMRSEEGDKDSFFRSGIHSKLLDKKDALILPDMLQLPISYLERGYASYGWNTITVGIFYGLPAFQLLLAEQMILNSTGDQDTCYYNFKCSRTWGVLSAFNNTWSNIGYIIFGTFFIIIVGIRHLWNRRANGREGYEPIGGDDEVQVRSAFCFRKRKKDYGVPQFYGIYYAMGVTLIMQGLMSSFYHICPNDSNFQFDTAFMYIIGGLLMLIIFQARHPDIHTNAFVAFLSFAVIIVLTLIGIYENSSRYWSTRIILLVLVMIAVTIFSISFYFYHDWGLNYFYYCRIWGKVRQWFRSWCPYKKYSPRDLIRFVKAISMVVVNFIVGLIMIFTGKGVATIILALFVANSFLYITIYLFSKLYFKEPWTISPFIYLVTIGICWACAFYFYFTNVAQWENTPAISREDNKDCKLLDFYDNHDIWHFLSSIALFFSFLFVLTLDDGLVDTRTNSIRVF